MVNIYGVIKQMMKAAMFISLIFVFMNWGALFIDYKHNNPDGTFATFLTHKEFAEWDNYLPPPPKFIRTVQLYNNTTKSIWFVLFFFVMFELFSYKEYPQKYWLLPYLTKLKKMQKKWSDDYAKINNKD